VPAQQSIGLNKEASLHLKSALPRSHSAGNQYHQSAVSVGEPGTVDVTVQTVQTVQHYQLLA
jgi:hypothetical protein